MADEEFDIYGDYNFDQSDDILDEIVNDSSSSERKRQRPKEEEPEEEEEEEEKVKSVKVPKTNERQEATSYHKSHSTYNSNNTSHGGGGTSYQSNNNSSNSSSYSRSQQLPVAITQLRGLSTHPTNSIYLGELHWYTTESQVKEPLEKAQLLDQLKDLTFYEHKVNGKSKGIVYIEFTNTEAASAAKSIYDKTKYYDKQVFAVYTTAPNPFKHLPKETVSKPSRNTPRMNNGPVMSAGGGNGGNNYPMNTFNNGFNGMGGMPYFPMGNRGSFMGNFGDMMGGSQRGRMRNTNYRMPRGGGNTGTNGGNGNYMGDGAGFGGMYINPAFFEQQQQGHNNNNN